MKVVINLDMKISGNFIEIPLGVFIELATQFISKFTPEQAVNINRNILLTMGANRCIINLS